MTSSARVLSLLLTSQAILALGSNLVRKTQVVAADGSVKSVQLDASLLSEADRGSQVQDMLTEIENMARSGASPEPEKIRTIKSIVNDELVPDLQKTHDAAAAQVVTNIAAITQCNTNAGTRLQEIASTTEKTVDSGRKSHASCREEEKGVTSTKDSKCKELDTFLNAVIVPADLPAGRPRDGMVQYVKTMTDYFCPKGPEVTKLDDACTAAEGAHAKHKAACDKLQATFELGFCTWRTELTDTCAAQTTCYDDAKKAYGEHVVATKELVKKWKVEYASLKKILCYVDVWLNDNNAKTVDKDQYAHCSSNTIDTSPMDVDYKSAPEKAECSLNAVQNHPGTPAFVTTEYSNFKEYVNDAIACLK